MLRYNAIYLIGYVYTPISYRTVVDAIDTTAQFGDYIKVPKIDYELSSGRFDGV